MARFPTVEALAEAPERRGAASVDRARILRTGRNLLACAKVLVERTWRGLSSGHRGGDRAARYRALDRRRHPRALAGRTASHSRWQRQAQPGAGVRDRGRSERRRRAQAALVGGGKLHAAPRVAHYTQAIMDLGATLCTRTRPACTVCPLVQICVAAREGRQAQLPGVEAAARAAFAGGRTPDRRERRGGLALGARRAPARSRHLGRPLVPAAIPERSGGARMVPPRAGRCRRHGIPAADRARFTHFDLRLQPLRVRFTPLSKARETQVREADDRIWYALRSPPKVGLPRPDPQALRADAQRSDQ